MTTPSQQDTTIVISGHVFVIPLPVADELARLRDENTIYERNDRVYRTMLEDKENEIRRMQEREFRQSSAPELLLDAIMEYGEHKGQGVRQMTLPLYKRNFADYIVSWKSDEDENRVTLTARAK